MICMDEKRLAGERLLGSWLNLSSTVWNRRRVSGMTFNEVLVCGLLKRRKDTEPDKFYIATELCAETGLFKSQMNKLINSMEEKGLVTRLRSEKDRRFVYIKLTGEGEMRYLKEHEGIMLMLDKLVDAVGTDCANDCADLVNKVTDGLKKIKDN